MVDLLGDANNGVGGAYTRLRFLDDTNGAKEIEKATGSVIPGKLLHAIELSDRQADMGHDVAPSLDFTEPPLKTKETPDIIKSSDPVVART